MIKALRNALLGAAALAGASALTAGQADAAIYDIGWAGGGGYSMTGALTFDDSLMGTGNIDETQIDDLSISVFLNGILQGSRSLLGDGLGSHAATFNLNFDTIAGAFLVGGFSGGLTGQDWFTSTGGTDCDTVGFSSGSGAQAVCVGGNIVLASFTGDFSALTATLRAPEVPLPAAGLLLLTGLAGMVLTGVRRKAA